MTGKTRTEERYDRLLDAAERGDPQALAVVRQLMHIRLNQAAARMAPWPDFRTITAT